MENEEAFAHFIKNPHSKACFSSKNIKAFNCNTKKIRAKIEHNTIKDILVIMGILINLRSF